MVTVTPESGEILSHPSVTLNVTVAKFVFVFVNWLSNRPIMYLPSSSVFTFVALTDAVPLNVKSSVVYSVVGSLPILMLVTS